MASKARNRDEPVINAACARPASGCALPWPKRCSLSAGSRDCFTATKLMNEAMESSKESIRLDNRATEPVRKKAASFISIRINATSNEA